MGSPSLFSGQFVKFLKDKLNLFDKAFILTGTQDPRVTATDAPKGSIMMRQTASGNGQVFYKLDNGSSTNWKLFTSDTSASSQVLESLKNQLVDSTYALITPNIGGFDGITKYASIIGAVFDSVVDAIKFTANAQIVTSTQMMDYAEFSPYSQDIQSIDLSVYWNRVGAIPTGFTHEVSRDGGTNWFPVTMSQVGATNAFSGSLTFDTSTTTESVDQTLATNATDNTSYALQTTTTQIAQKIVVPASTIWRVKSALVTVTKTGTPAGTISASIVKDTAGLPSTATADILSTSNAITANSFVTGSNSVELSDVSLPAGTYWLVFSADATYVAASGANFLGFNATSTGGTGVARYVSGIWNTTGTTASSLVHSIKGRAIDLRVRITSAGSPSYPCYLDGYGIFYGANSDAIVKSVKKVQRFTFNSVTDNTSSFAITSFSPDTDLLECHYVQAGQVFKVPAFELSGNTAVFPVNSFNNGGISTTITLIFSQPDGGSYDGADSNARLLAFNHLGSTSGADDRSVAGRGVVLRNGAGILMELALDSDGLLTISSVP